MQTPHGIHAAADGTVWVTDFAANADGTKGHQVHQFSADGELLMSLGKPGQSGTGPDVFNQPMMSSSDQTAAFMFEAQRPGHDQQPGDGEGRASGNTARIMKFAPDGTFIKQWGEIGVRHGEFRTPHAMEFDAYGRLWVADRGNHRLEIFDQEEIIWSLVTHTVVSADCLSLMMHGVCH